MSEIPAGAMRFNSDSQKLEYWNGSAWFQVHTASVGIATATDSDIGVRAIFAGGYNAEVSPAVTHQTIEFTNIATTGTCHDFGDMSQTRHQGQAFSSSTRGCIMCGVSGSENDRIDVLTIASRGSCVDSGFDVGPAFTSLGEMNQGFSNATRGIISGGGPSAGRKDVMEYVTIAALSNSIDFGDLSVARSRASSIASPVRGVVAGGTSGGNSDEIVTMDFVQIATTGRTADDFGDLLEARQFPMGTGNAIRGVFGGGGHPAVNTIDYITIATTGNATGFGDLSVTKTFAGAATSPTRGLYAGGYTPTAGTQPIDMIDVNTQGNAVDYGDLIRARYLLTGLSNGHGGL